MSYAVTFAGLIQLDEGCIISSSPERLVSVKNKVLETRPIAGTRPRGSSGLTDVELIKELIDSEKERAEHLMLVDLERNDISRVCKSGTVEVDEMMVVESYSHVHHIVSKILRHQLQHYFQMLFLLLIQMENPMFQISKKHLLQIQYYYSLLMLLSLEFLCLRFFEITLLLL